MKLKYIADNYRVILIYEDEWFAIYIDGNLIDEGHSPRHISGGDDTYILKLSDTFSFSIKDVISIELVDIIDRYPIKIGEFNEDTKIQKIG